MTLMRGLQLLLKVMVPGNVTKCMDIQNTISKWEGHSHAGVGLQREDQRHGEDRCAYKHDPR